MRVYLDTAPIIYLIEGSPALCCDCLLTNDHRLDRIPEVPIEVLAL